MAAMGVEGEEGVVVSAANVTTNPLGWFGFRTIVAAGSPGCVGGLSDDFGVGA